MSYTIKIEKNEKRSRKVNRGHEYMILSVTGEGASKKEERGYTPDDWVDGSEAVKVEVYTQVVDDLDLVAVINAVNAGPKKA